jgi:hypothetical protein
MVSQAGDEDGGHTRTLPVVTITDRPTIVGSSNRRLHTLGNDRP